MADTTPRRPTRTSPPDDPTTADDDRHPGPGCRAGPLEVGGPQARAAREVERCRRRKLAKIEEASKSELERAQAAATAAEERAKAAEERIARALTKAAVSAAAVKAGAIDADAVLALLPADAVTVDGGT